MLENVDNCRKLPEVFRHCLKFDDFVDILWGGDLQVLLKHEGKVDL